ncbi:MAG: FHA domain-containing protein [Butyrivibrio sp.]
MRITKCQGADAHFFDGDKYKVCPVCGSPSVENSMQWNNAREDNRREQEYGYDIGVHEQRKPDAETPHKPSKIWGSKKNKEKNSDVNTVAVYSEIDNDSSLTVAVGYGEENNVANNVVNNSEINTANNEESNRATVVEKIDSGKTIGFYANVNNEPVVGWLVCIKGESQGESYNLKAGKNTIGRGAGMDVMLAQEKSISREKHAVITYEPKKRVFILQAGESSGLVYLNENLLMTYEEIHAYDVIQLGEALFMFMPFCGEKFTWDDYIS